MQINVIDLVNELTEAACLNLDNRDDISSETKYILQNMAHSIQQLLHDETPYKQEHMILMFLGSVVAALGTENFNYYHTRRLYLGEADVKAVKKKSSIKKEGSLVLTDMPSYFCGQLFTLPFYDEYKRECLMFPGLAEKTQKIDYLVNFCINHKRDLNVPTFTVEDEVSIHYSLPTLSGIFADKFQAFCDNNRSYFKKAASHFVTFKEAPSLIDYTEEEIFSLAKTNSSEGKRVLSFLKSLNIVDEQGEPFENGYYSQAHPQHTKSAKDEAPIAEAPESPRI